MKRILIAFGLLLSVIPVASTAQSVRQPELKAMETFVLVNFSLDAGTAVIREYALSSTGDEETAVAQVERLSALVQENGLFAERYGGKNLTVLQEKLTRNNSFITAEYVLAGRARNKASFLQSLYRVLLDPKVKVQKRGDLLRMQFSESSFRVSEGNATGVQVRGDDVWVEWPEDARNFELLLAPTNLVPGDLLSLEPYLSATVAGPSILDEGGTNTKLQHDFDIARLNDLMTLSAYIEQYQAATGRYPLQGEAALPNYVFIATREQRKSISDMPIPHTLTSVTTLMAELQRVLGADLRLPFDPQQLTANGKPVFYIYMIVDERWYLAVHLHESFPFANKIADYYYKVEITNNPDPGAGQWSRSGLLNNPQFRDVLARTPHQPNYVDALREDLGGNSAF